MQSSASFILSESIDIDNFFILDGSLPDDITMMIPDDIAMMISDLFREQGDNDDDDDDEGPHAVGPFEVVPTQYDVKCGRGGDTIQHNEHFIDMCEAKAEAYHAAGKRTRGMSGKHGIVMEVINAIEAKQGRFIRQTSTSDTPDGDQHWEVLSTEDAMKKTAHCIRDILRRRGRSNEQQKA
jgi:hypothetical protein